MVRALKKGVSKCQTKCDEAKVKGTRRKRNLFFIFFLIWFFPPHVPPLVSILLVLILQDAFNMRCKIS